MADFSGVTRAPAPGEVIGSGFLRSLAQAAGVHTNGLEGRVGPGFHAVAVPNRGGPKVRKGRALDDAEKGSWFEVREYHQPSGETGGHPTKVWTDADRVTGAGGKHWVYADIGEVTRNAKCYFVEPDGATGYELLQSECDVQTDEDVEDQEGSPLE